MYDDTFIDIVRQSAYPIDAPEGPAYERDRVRECLDAIGAFSAGKDTDGFRLAVAKAEAATVVKACFAAVFGNALK
jgi:hypothetical protein